MEADDDGDYVKVGFQDEALRRMQRKAGVASVSRSGKHLATVDDQLRAIAESILDVVLEKVLIFCDYHGNKTVTLRILSQALDGLYAPEHYPGGGDLPPCTSYRAASPAAKGRAKAKANARAPAAGKPQPCGGTAAREIAHENNSEDCLYNERAPFSRMVRQAMRAKREEPISATGHSVVPSALAEGGEFTFSSEARILATKLAKWFKHTLIPWKKQAYWV